MTLAVGQTSPKPVCLITGATEGLGQATATKLASKGFTVVLAARNAKKAAAVKTQIETTAGGDVGVLLADLASLRAVRELADAFKERYSRLDVLINNAGVFKPARVLTGDGFETMYQVNYLSHFLLTHLLLDQLKASEQGRVINLSSSVYAAGRFDAQNVQSEKSFSVFGAYAASKLFVLLFSIELAARLQGTNVTSNAVHPGIVRTQMMLAAPGFFRLLSYLALPFSVSPDEGAATSVYLASSPSVRGISGGYFKDCKPAPVKSRFNTKSIRERLWDKSMDSLRPFGSARA